MKDLFNALAPEGRKTLLVTAENDTNIVASSRNLERLTVRTASDVNALDVLRAKRVIVVQDALANLEARLA
jgi:large subunit ribosomal protein L4